MQLERRLIARLKTANIRFTDAQIERIWAIASAHKAGLSIRKIAGATGLSSSRIHQLLNAPEGKEIPVWLSQLRQSSRGPGGRKKAKRPESETEIRSRLAREVEVLRRCTDWLQRLERGENVVVNLRPDEDFETEFVAFDRPRIVRVLEFGCRRRLFREPRRRRYLATIRERVTAQIPLEYRHRFGGCG